MERTPRSGSIAPHDELVAAIAAEGPYDLIVDYLWGAPAEATFAALGDAVAYDDLLQQVAAGEIVVDLDPVPLADVEHAWPKAGSDRRIVFVP